MVVLGNSILERFPGAFIRKGSQELYISIPTGRPYKHSLD